MAVGTLLGGPLGDKIGRKYVIWFSILGMLPFTLMLPYANLFWTGILSVIIGLVMASAFPAIVVYAQELLPGRVGMISGLFFGLSFGMGGIGAAVLGALADAHLHHLCLQGLRFPAGDRTAGRCSCPASRRKQMSMPSGSGAMVARRKYAVAVSPHLLDADRSRRSQRSHRAPVPAVAGRVERSCRKNAPIPSAMRRIRRSPGIVHRHPDRVLFKVVSACPVYCRFCFRREMIGPGKGQWLSPDDFEAALAYIAAPSAKSAKSF